MSKAKCIMVQGTMSGAGKSLLCAALCRIFAQDGYRVAPFKSQNMALNSFVTRDGLEMGRAQVVQAQAAGIEPDVRMNPILLKPSSDVGSQVIVNGEVRGQMPAAAYFKMKRALIPEILSAYNSLAETVDIIVIEGAGSPAEINLKADDIVNMGLARLVDAPVLLAGDIDRGGVFAQLYGTVALLEPEERARIKGLLINKFRGDVEILRPGLAMLEEKTQLPVLGVVPYLRVEIEDEDSLSDRLEAKSAVKPLDIAILRLPHVSNFTDFIPLEQHPLLGVRYVQRTRQLGAPDLVILPGTKNTMDDLRWLRESGLEAAGSLSSAAGSACSASCAAVSFWNSGRRLSDSTWLRYRLSTSDLKRVTSRRTRSYSRSSARRFSFASFSISSARSFAFCSSSLASRMISSPRRFARWMISSAFWFASRMTFSPMRCALISALLSISPSASKLFSSSCSFWFSAVKSAICLRSCSACASSSRSCSSTLSRKRSTSSVR